MAERHSVLDRIICMVQFFFSEIHKMELCAHCALCSLSWLCDFVFEFVCMSQHELVSGGQTFVLQQKHSLGPHGERTALTGLWPGEWTQIRPHLPKASLWRTLKNALILFVFIFFNFLYVGRKCKIYYNVGETYLFLYNFYIYFQLKDFKDILWFLPKG